MDWHHLLQVILIAIVEGITEFLPVSSTGHMILAGELIGFKGPSEASFEIIIQLGAILAVCVVFWRRLGDVVVGLLKWDTQAVLFTRNVLLGFLPAAIIGFLLKKKIEALLERPDIVAIALIVGGIAILLIERMRHRNSITSVEKMTVPVSLGVGLAQCLAMVPGVSRSGATIMGGLLMGIDRKTVAEYSFFLAIPTMAGATALQLGKNLHSFHRGDMVDLAIGFVIAFVVALLVVRSFIGFISRYGFAPFAWYRIVVGVAALVWLGLRG
jgi:undecaprenyl-diphosphatase